MAAAVVVDFLDVLRVVVFLPADPRAFDFFAVDRLDARDPPVARVVVFFAVRLEARRTGVFFFVAFRVVDRFAAGFALLDLLARVFFGVGFLAAVFLAVFLADDPADDFRVAVFFRDGVFFFVGLMGPGR